MWVAVVLLVRAYKLHLIGEKRAGTADTKLQSNK